MQCGPVLPCQVYLMLKKSDSVKAFALTMSPGIVAWDSFRLISLERAGIDKAARLSPCEGKSTVPLSRVSCFCFFAQEFDNKQ